jgi:hypothetical protein
MAKLYCPQDRCECGTEACPTDAEGKCARCGKPPVAWEDRDKKHFWCTVHSQWHEAPCMEDRQRHCCAEAA